MSSSRPVDTHLCHNHDQAHDKLYQILTDV